MSQQNITFFTVYNNTDSQCDDTLYKKNSILQTIHLASIFRFFFCFFFSSFFFPFFFKFSYKIVQNYSALIEDFANPNKKSIYLTVLFIQWKQFGTLVRILYRWKSCSLASFRCIHWFFKTLNCTKGVTFPNFLISTLIMCVTKWQRKCRFCS